MSAIFILLAASLTIAVIFLVFFIFSFRNGQFEDDYTPSVRILFDDEPASEKDRPQNSK